MDSSGNWTTNTVYHTRRLDEYKEAISRLFPALSRGYVNAWSISDTDALTLGLFLECYPRRVVVLDVGTFVGVSAFCFAGQPKVLSVISVDPNPTISYEINDKSEMLGFKKMDPGALGDLRVLDVAHSALSEFDDERAKVRLCEGVIGSTQVSVSSNTDAENETRLDVLPGDLPDGAGVLAFIDGLHTRQGVEADLEAVFSKHPRAVAILDDCRHTWGPFIQAGVVGFLENAQEKYHFQLLADLGPGISTSNLGLVYPDIEVTEVQRTLVEFKELFSERLDPLRLLRREEELIGIAYSSKKAEDKSVEDRHTLAKRNSQLKDRNSQLKKRNSQLKKRSSQLKKRSSQLKKRDAQGGRNNVARGVTEKVLRLPGIKRLVQRKSEQ
jgi:hypothetical protein